MTPEEFARQLDAELEFDFEHDGVTWRLREWTEPQYMGLIARIPNDQLGRFAACAPVMVPPTIVGWQGLKWSDLRPGASDEPLPFARSLVEHVLDRRRGTLAALMIELDRRYTARDRKAKAELGN